MRNWGNYRKELMGALGTLGALNPDLLKADTLLTGATPARSALGEKMRELIALAVAVTTRCDGCIAFHTDRARKAGATKDEVAEALGVAIALNEGAALVYSARAIHAFEEA